MNEILERKNNESENEPTSKKHAFSIPAKTGDYYVRVALTKKEFDQLLEDEGTEDEDGEKYLEFGVAKYFKMRVTK